ncbi:MAG: hypothetical protein JWP27_609 [Flaviaesturariibacter sp.]|nr:hypothetical protein [Flaviaesturariibacter sp.]
MRLANSILLKRKRTGAAHVVLGLSLLAMASGAGAQSNSPYSRYGVGDLTPSNNVVNRSMGGTSAADAPFLNINFNNPASYSGFQAFLENRSKKMQSGRVILDAGVNLESRTIREPNQAAKFSATDLYFSYLQIGIPLRRGWGLAFGLRPLSRIAYKVQQAKRLTGIDSSLSEFEGSGGSWLPSIGTGYAIKDLSIGVNVGYLFGRRETSTTLGLLNDTVLYYNAVNRMSSSYGGLFANAGAQYTFYLDSLRQTYLRVGVTGNMKRTFKASQDLDVSTFDGDPNAAVDTVYTVKGMKGEVIHPSSITVGVQAGSSNPETGRTWQLAADVSHTKWSEYRFFGSADAVQNTTTFHVGGSYRPVYNQRAYFSAVTYRAGFWAGQDYVTAGGKLPSWGASFGLGLPIANYARQTQQFTLLNLGLEYNKRGNNSNVLKENTFRFSVGFNFSDLWFNKRKYD